MNRFDVTTPYCDQFLTGLVCQFEGTIKTLTKIRIFNKFLYLAKPRTSFRFQSTERDLNSSLDLQRTAGSHWDPIQILQRQKKPSFEFVYNSKHAAYHSKTLNKPSKRSRRPQKAQKVLCLGKPKTPGLLMEPTTTVVRVEPV